MEKITPNEVTASELPSSWQWVSLEQITAKIQYGHTESAKGEPVGPKFLRITDIQDGQVDWNSVPYCVCTEEEHQKYRLEPNDIVFARTGATTGKSYLITSCPDAVFASYLIRISLDETINAKYVAAFFESPLYWSQIMNVRKGSAQPGVNATILAELKVPIAPIQEQSRIAQEVEKQLTRLDAAVSALKRLQTNLARYKAAVLKAACEGRLVSQDPNDEPADKLLERILAERRRKWEEAELAKMVAAGKPPKDDKWKARYQEPERPDTSELPELPAGWVWASVEQLGDHNEQAVLTGPFGSNLGREDFTETGVPVLTIGCLTEQGVTLDKAFYIAESKATELERYRVKTGDLLFSRMASVGRAGLIPERLKGAVINYHLMRLRLTAAAINPHYFIAYVRGASAVTSYIREVNHGATRDGINTSQLLAMPVALPPIKEQQNIIEEVERHLSTVEKLEKSVIDDLARAGRLRQAILQKAFSGRLVPQDPNDESAAELLERIRGRRAPSPDPVGFRKPTGSNAGSNARSNGRKKKTP